MKLIKDDIFLHTVKLHRSIIVFNRGTDAQLVLAMIFLTLKKGTVVTQIPISVRYTNPLLMRLLSS